MAPLTDDDLDPLDHPPLHWLDIVKKAPACDCKREECSITVSNCTSCGGRPRLHILRSKPVALIMCEKCQMFLGSLALATGGDA